MSVAEPIFTFLRINRPMYTKPLDYKRHTITVGAKSLPYQVKKCCVFVLFFLFVFPSKGWCDSNSDKDESVADYKICDHNTMESNLKKIKNIKKYFLKYADWQGPEKTIWNKICRGEEINLNKKPERLTCEEENQRVVNPLFLNTILLDPALKKIVSHKGVRIKCAKFKEKLDLSGISIGFPLVISESTFEKKVDLSWLKSDANIAFKHSIFREGIDFNNIETGSDLEISNSLVYESDESEAAKSEKPSGLFGAKIGEQLLLMGTYFEGYLDIKKAQVADCLDASKAIFSKKVDMLNADVGGDVIFINANMDNGKRSLSPNSDLLLTNISIGQTLDMRNGLFNKVNLVNSDIGNNLMLDKSEFNGSLAMEKIRVGGNLSARNIVLENSHDTSVPLSVNLTSGNILGDLILIRNLWDNPKLKKNYRLILRDLEIRNLIENKESWPAYLDLFGFRYKRLYNSSQEELSDFHKQDIAWIGEWFKRSSNPEISKRQDFSLQPYFQMASVIEESGNKERANEIRRLGKDAELENTNDFLNSCWLFFQKIFIGYGYSNRRVGIVFLALLIFGTCLCKKFKLLPNINSFEFNLDLLLPIIELNKESHGPALQNLKRGWRYYFYFHKIMGYVLASYLIAGLTGFGK